MTRFKEKVIIITGVAGGIRKEVVRKLANEEAKVVLVDLNEEAIHAVQTELGLTDSDSLAIKADVSIKANVKHYVDQTIEKFGRIDGFVNNTGVEGPAKALEAATFNVRVNTVNPGVINTQMMRKIGNNVAPGAGGDVRAAYNDAVPMQRYGELEEVANVIAFLLSDEASYLSSSSFTIDGALYNV